MSDHSSVCIEPGVEPLLAELHETVELQHLRPGHAGRHHVQGFVRTVFQRAHGAAVESFCPHLLGFHAGAELRAVVGYRDAGDEPLFPEQYLSGPAEHLIARRLGEAVPRHQLVEVGNLALAHPGQARWLIASTTAFLSAAGYRWVLFTANRPLANAFRRLGLRPLPLAPADPNRLPDRGASWGSYYDAGPVVYAGDILAGCAKLHAGSWTRRPRLGTLLESARHLGAAACGRVPAAACQ
jgi:hypothetical protein